MGEIKRYTCEKCGYTSDDIFTGTGFLQKEIVEVAPIGGHLIGTIEDYIEALDPNEEEDKEELIHLKELVELKFWKMGECPCCHERGEDIVSEFMVGCWD